MTVILTKESGCDTFGEYAVNLINVSDEVHDDGEEPVPVRQVVPLLDIDPHQFVVVKGRSPGATCLVSMQLI